MSFNAKQRQVLRSVRDRKWQVVCGMIRVRGVRRNGDFEEVCPVCAAAIKVTPLPYAYEAKLANETAGLGLSHEEVKEIMVASDSPGTPNRQELMQLLGMTP